MIFLFFSTDVKMKKKESTPTVSLLVHPLNRPYSTIVPFLKKFHSLIPWKSLCSSCPVFRITNTIELIRSPLLSLKNLCDCEKDSKSSMVKKNVLFWQSCVVFFVVRLQIFWHQILDNFINILNYNLIIWMKKQKKTYQAKFLFRFAFSPSR